MAQIRNRFDIQNSIAQEAAPVLKKLPNFFNTHDEMNTSVGIILSVFVHVLLLFLFLLAALLQSLVFPRLPLPELAKQDIEFKLVQNESKPPINKNTKIRSDRDSRAGGKHDPKRAVAEPSAKASVPSKAAPSAQPKPSVQKPQPQQPQQKAQQPAKPQLKPALPQKIAQKPQPQQVQQPAKPQAPSKPTPIKAPGVPSAIKPTVSQQGVAKPSAPKIASVPKSPFNIPAPTSNSPAGKTYKPAGTPGSSGSSGASGGAKGSLGPAPKFSSSGANSGGSGSSGSMGTRYASRGTGGSGSSGNPSPGNPNGAPGIDAIRQPNWGPYMRDLEQRIKRNWTPPKGDSSKRIVITFTIGRDGRLLSHKITKSSGVPLADRAAMSAIELTAPFRPLPPEFKGTSVPIEFTFDYNVLNSVLK